MRKRKADAAASAKVGKVSDMANAYCQLRAKAQAKAAAHGEVEVRRVEGLSVLNVHAAGIDIGSRSHWVCVGVSADKDADVIREFSASTEGLHALVAYLSEVGVEMSRFATVQHFCSWLGLCPLLKIAIWLRGRCAPRTTAM